MAHKITELFKKRNSFPRRNDKEEIPETVKEMFASLGERLDKVEQTLEELVNKK